MSLSKVSRTASAVEVSNTEDIGGAALGDAVETVGASIVWSWRGAIVTAALDWVGHNGGGEESDE